MIFPTTGLYGLGTNALAPASVERLYNLKKRAGTKPILVLVDRLSQVDALAREIPASARACMDRFWPGGLTLILPARPGLPKGLTAGSGRIGIRMAAHPVARALIRALGGPVTGTSANLSGRRSPSRIAHIDDELIASVEMVLDAGPLSGGAGSTIVDLTGPQPRLVREGRIPWGEIRNAL